MLSPRFTTSLAALALPLALLASHSPSNGGPFLNPHWGGYSIGFVNPDPQNWPLAVGATWKVPTVTKCPTVRLADIAVWVGLGGTNSNDLEQIGINAQCQLGQLTYQAVSQLLPSQPQAVPLPPGHPISPGDSIRADVVEQGAGTGGSQFVLQMWDDTKHWYYPQIWIGPGTGDPNVTPLTADWIAEDVFNGLIQDAFPRYSPALVFRNCYWWQDNTQHQLIQGSNLIDYTIVTQIGGIGKEITGPIAANGTQFSMTWQHE